MPKIPHTQEIKNENKIIPDALHGTDIASYKLICREGFKHSTGEKQFLGDGIYFWEGSYELALRWAIRKAKEKRSRDYVIIKATINLGICLDLTRPEHLEIVSTVARYLERSTTKPINDPIVMNFINYAIQKIDSIRAINPKSKSPVFKGSRYLSKIEPIICLKEINNIISYNLIEQDQF